VKATHTTTTVLYVTKKFVFPLQEVIDANLIPLIIDALETVWKKNFLTIER
jgi:hypothetical protein